MTEETVVRIAEAIEQLARNVSHVSLSVGLVGFLLFLMLVFKNMSGKS